MAERNTAIHTTAGLLSAVVAVERLLNFSEVVNSIVDRSLPRLFATDGKERFWISHNNRFLNT